jgi:putative membrane protein
MNPVEPSDPSPSADPGVDSELAVAADARRLHPLSPVLGVVPALKPFALPVLLTVLGGGPGALLVFLVVAGGAVAVGAVRQRCTRYALRDDELVVWSGVLNRRVRVVSPMRVQKVEVVRLLRHRLTDVGAVHVELVGAGSDATRVKLDALGLPEAERVRDTLERGRRRVTSGAVPGPAPQPDPLSTPPLPPLLRLGPGMLALGGVTGAPLLLVPVALLSLMSELGGRVEDTVGSWFAGVRLAAAIVAALVVLLVGVWAVVAAAFMIVRFHGYELARSGDDVVVRRGLLDTRTSVIPLRRVQLVHVTGTVLRRWLGLASIDVRTASLGTGAGPFSLGVTVPVLAAPDVGRILPVLLGRVVVVDADRAHPPAARRRAVLRRSVLLVPVGGLVGSAAAAGAGADAGVVVGVALVGVASGVVVARVWGAAWYRRLAHGLGDGLLVATDGVLVAHRRIVPLDRVQSVVVTQSPFQRRAGVVDLVAHLAGPTPDLRLRDLAPGQALTVARSVRGLSTTSLPLGGATVPGEPGHVRPSTDATGFRSVGGGGRESNPPDGDHPSHPL